MSPKRLLRTLHVTHSGLSFILPSVGRQRRFYVAEHDSVYHSGQLLWRQLREWTEKEKTDLKNS